MVRPKVLLVGGSSHGGKSTVARIVARRFGCEARSTDKLARHPGRPWPTADFPLPPHVAEHYLGLDAPALLASVLAHYQSMWPLVETLVRDHAEDAEAPGLVLEGSALWPANVATLEAPGVAAVWLTAPPAVFETRIRRESAYEAADPRGRAMIDAFVERTLRFDRAMMDCVLSLGLPQVRVEDGMDPEAVADLCLAAARPPSAAA